MVVGVCRLSLHFADSSSLKAKRQRLRRIVERCRSRFNAAVAEVADQDSWQRATVGVSVVGNAEAHVHSMLDGLLRFVEDLYLGQVLSTEREILHYSDDEELDPGLEVEGFEGWEPEEIRR
ncbi:MAG: cytoplasmic protein [Proteobacteria bacterium]|nr:MAG: cytoplasmic protein [Pseudomonadota bacterium]PIE18890.1 MAG: cytoplasmic protein [Pseudomonadota bacterium]